MWFNFPPLRFKNPPYKLLVKIVKIFVIYKFYYYICIIINNKIFNMEKSNQFVIVPKKENGILLKKYEILIYACIRRYMNKDTMIAYPSISTIAKDSGCSKPTVLKTLQNIKNKGYIEIIEGSKGQGNHYKFNNELSFEPFSYEFLDNKNLTKSEKLQILCTQQYMFKEGGIGKISYSDRELSELTGLDRQTISRNNASLINKNYMSQISLKTRESDSGCFNKETIYHLRDLGQAIIFTLMNHEDQINQNTKDIEYLKENFNTVLEQRDSAYKDRDKYLEEANH